MSLQPRYRKGDRIGGRYLVHQALLGGMGEVYLCLDLEMNLPFALKTFQARYLTNQRIRELFAQEVGTWVALEKHPNIVHCFEMRMFDDQPFILLEWVAGEKGRGTDLRNWLRHGPFDLRTTLDFTIDICRGLIHAQTKEPGLVHRDLKPENILVAQGRVAKITDFGLATLVQQVGLALAADASSRIERQPVVGLRDVVGTPPYMAPEQWQAERVDARTDIYAVGCIFYELLIGTVPYPATTIEGFRQLHRTAPVPVIVTNDDLPANLNMVLSQCLAKQPDNRFASAEELLNVLIELYRAYMGVEPRAMPDIAAFTVTDYTNRGNTYDELGRYDDALADYNHAITLDPALAPTYSNRGLTYDKLGRFDNALADYNHAIELDPTFGLAFSNRGAIYADLGRSEVALADFIRAIEFDPTNAKAYFNRGNTYDKLGRVEDALADYTQAITLDPSFALAFSNRGLTYYDLGRFEDALIDFTQAIKLNPADAPVHFNRGLTYHNLGRVDDALDDFTHTIELDPAYADAYINIGVLLNNQGKRHKAVRYFEQAAHLGDTRGAQLATQVRQMLGMGSSDEGPGQ